MQPPTNPWNDKTTKPTCVSLKPSTKPMKPNPWNWETRETTKLMKSQNPGHTKSSHEIALLMEPIITKPAKPVKTTKPLKSQNSWNHETSKLWHLRKFRHPRSSKRLQVPCEQHEILNTKKPLKSQNLWNHETSNYNTYYRHLKQNTINAMKPWILALALYCRSFHFRDFFFLRGGGGEGGNTQALDPEWCYNFNRPILIR